MSHVIAIVGAESTGKTTLARELAQAMTERGIAAVAVPEYLREFCDTHGRTPTEAEQHDIADEQWRRIEAAATDGRWVVADTTPLMTAVYSDFAFGDTSLYASAQARQARCTHTLLTGLDIDWRPDGLQRDGPQVRGPVDALVRAALDGAALPCSVVYGEGPARLAAALAALRPWLPTMPATPAMGTALDMPDDRPQRLSARCRECLQPGCEHLLFARPTSHPPRAIRSFVLRAGRMGSGQARALTELGPRFVLPYAPEPIDPQAVFGRRAPLVLEIGFGMGDATAQIAAAQPHTDFIGCEVHQPGVGALLRQIGERGLTNLRIVQHDAVEVLEHMIAPASLAGIHLFFPDPWHKKKHHKRRLVQPAFVARLVTRLAPGGTLHCATDWEPYAAQMLEVLGAEPALKNTAEGYATKPGYRPLTKFEDRGLRLGHGVWDLVFERG